MRVFVLCLFFVIATFAEAAHVYRADGSSFTVERAPHLAAIEEHATTASSVPFNERWRKGTLRYTNRQQSAAQPV